MRCKQIGQRCEISDYIRERPVLEPFHATIAHLHRMQVMSMRAWVIDQFDGIEKSRLTEVADPVPAAGEVLLRVTCAALNPADRYLAQGEYPARPPLPHILGRDGSGVIAGCGPGVQGFAIGKKRAILRCEVGVTRWGTLAKLVDVPGACV